MTSANYRNGANLERAAKRLLEYNGYYVIKSGGSKGIIDLAAFKPGELLFVQCKLDGYLTPGERLNLRKAAVLCDARPLIGSWAKEGRAARTVRFREVPSIHLNSLKDWTPDYGLEES